ncbi:cysteine hydrolase [Desulfoplanes formicivorans]|uniref:Isochorismatase n=1 Tax=Desulfoplanes formicivorans TaxID=1592317 RepID=A0A194ADG4_9BACT|nr:cysteine hydrolase [Desulfoplanes formicivorans]GAU07388.1 isochorismatase [Desulfoplanes formicivorans]
MRRVPHVLLLLFCLLPCAAMAASIDEIWDEVSPPDLPEIRTVTVAPATTALLVLDIEELTCNQARRPRCLETVPRIAALIKRARAAGLPVVYSMTPRGTLDTMLPPVTPEPGEPVVHSSVDKFWNTDLEDILKSKGITSVIVTGTAAHGAVLHTATAAGFRGMHVVLPVDCLSAADPYVEQATIILLKTGPGTSKRISLTRSDRITIK